MACRFAVPNPGTIAPFGRYHAGRGVPERSIPLQANFLVLRVFAMLQGLGGSQAAYQEAVSFICLRSKPKRGSARKLTKGRSLRNQMMPMRTARASSGDRPRSGTAMSFAVSSLRWRR